MLQRLTVEVAAVPDACMIHCRMDVLVKTGDAALFDFAPACSLFFSCDVRECQIA